MYSFRNREVVSKSFLRTSAKIFQPLKLKIPHFKEFETCQKSINMTVNKVNKNIIGDGYIPTINVLPRQERPVYVPPRIRTKKDPWSFGISVFKDYQLDTDELLKKCFEEDWIHARISKIIKNSEDLQNVKEYLLSQYKYYKACYKYLSTINPVKDIPAIQNFVFHQLVHDCKILDNNLRQQELDLKYIATNTNQEMLNVKVNPQRGLVRFELNECFVRIAEEKFIKTQICSNYYTAIKKLYDEHLLQTFYNYNQIVNTWRTDTYFTEKVDHTIKHYKEYINQIYTKYSVKHVLPGQKRFVSMDEMYDICRDCGILADQNFQECDPSISFFLAQQTQVDELNQKIHMQQYQIEFYESLSRLADKCSLGKVPVSNQEDEDAHLNWTERMNQPLHIKLEALIHRICKASLGIELPRPSIWENYESEQEEEEEEELDLGNRNSQILNRATDRITFMRNMNKLTMIQKQQTQVTNENQ